MTEPAQITCFHLNQLGDCLFSLPAIYNIRQRFPSAHITSVARAACCELLGSTGLVDDTIERGRGARSDLRIAYQLRGIGPDLSVLFSTSTAVWLMSQLSAARTKAGFTRSMHGLLLSTKAPWSPPPSTENNLRLSDAVGCPRVKSDYVGLVRPDDVAAADAESLLQSIALADRPFVIMAPGTSRGREIKSWHVERYAQVSDRLAEDHGLPSVVVGVGGGDAITGLTEHAVDLTGRTRILTLAAILGRASLFIGVDSGAMHLAAAMGTPVIGMFGPSDFRKTGPQGEGHTVLSAGVDCSPCLRKRCADPVCMERISVEDVAGAAARILGGTGSAK